MSYVNAPACRMLATHCCMCGLPLVDADSVEAGIGPVCRRKRALVTETPRWDDVTTHLAAWAACERGDDERVVIFEACMELSVTADVDEDAARRTCNVVTHYLAATWGRRERGLSHLLIAIRAMGRVQLADILAKRAYKVRIERDPSDETRAFVTCPYDDGFRSMMWRDGRRVGTWDKARKAYRVSSADRAYVLRALAHCYGGVALGPDGHEIELTRDVSAAA